MQQLAFKGIPGSFSHQAAIHHFGNTSLKLLYCDEFSDIFDAVEKSNYLGVIPIENSLAGSILENYDLLYERCVHITEEFWLPIEHFLLGLPLEEGENLLERMKQVKEVLSHPQPLHQTANFLKNYPWIKQVATLSSSHAAEQVAKTSTKTKIAIGSKEAAKIYQLSILASNIEDNQHNLTRFFVINKGEYSPAVQQSTKCITVQNIPGLVQEKRSDSVPDANFEENREEQSTKSYLSSEIFPYDNTNETLSAYLPKCSITLELPHKPGSLITFLNLLYKKGSNLTKLESRPIHGKPFHYRFYIDFEVANFDSSLIVELGNNSLSLKVLGVYGVPN